MIDMHLHTRVLRSGAGVAFGLAELTSVDAHGAWFVQAQNFQAITRRFDLLERSPGALFHSMQGGWRLTDELPDTDVETGAVMDPMTFASRWQRDPAKVLLHMMKKHEGELRELEGYWCHGRGDVPDFLFDPQFALSQTDWSLCKGLGKGTTTSKYQAEADIAWSMSQKQKGKSKEGKGDGGKAQQLQGKSKEGKGDGGKAQQLLAVGSQRSKDLYDEQHLVFQSNVLKLNGDGTWQYRAGTAISLPQLLLSLGPSYTAAQLYAYFNTSKTLATKRPHAWSSPWREAAKYKRYQETGRYGFGR
jgi:hypothetical protein